MSDFTIRTIEQLAAVAYAIVPSGQRDRYILAGVNKTGEFLCVTLSFAEFDRSRDSVATHIESVFDSGLAIVEASTLSEAMERTAAIAEMVRPHMAIGTLIGDDLTLAGVLYRMEHLTCQIPDGLRPTITPLTVWEETAARRFEPIAPAALTLDVDERRVVLRKLVELAETGELPDERLIAQVAVFFRERSTRDEIFNTAIGSAPDADEVARAARYDYVFKDPDARVSHQDGWRPLLRFLAEHVVDEVAAHAWANAGAFAWATGKTTIMEGCARRALDLEPDHSFASLLMRAARDGLRPAWVERRLNGS